MRILIINPNSDDEVSKSIEKSAREFANGEFEVDCVSTPGAPKFIDTYSDQAAALPGMMKLLRENEDKYDAFIDACHCDPNLNLLKEMTKKPVIGIGEASMKLATMLGHSFSVISTAAHSVPNKQALIASYGLTQSLASVKSPLDENAPISDEQKFLETAIRARDEDMAEVIVLGCAGLTGLDKKIEEKIGIPVLDGIICALIVASGFVKYNVSTSKIRRYNPIA